MMNHQYSRFFVLFITCMVISCSSPSADSAAEAEPIKEWTAEDTRDLAGLTEKRGLRLKTDDATDGYIYFTPSDHSSHYLMNLDGEIVHEWEGELESTGAYLQPNGNLIRTARDPDFPTFNGGGQQGRIQEVSWDGELLWNFEYADENHLTHHDIEVMPNGNILAIAWEVFTKEEALQAGRDPHYLPESGLWMDHIIEIEPTRPEGGNIVWEWHQKDHLVQDFDETRDNYGSVRDNSGKLDFNFHFPRPQVPQEQLEAMQEMDQMPDNLTADNWNSEWGHVNSIDYNEELDQIAFTSLEFGEVFIIDHSTTTEEAKGSTGGRYGRGGDFLYRWGNPQNYDMGTPEDQQLFGIHDVKWIDKGMPGAGNLTVFNNNLPGLPDQFTNTFYAFFGVMDHATAVPLSEWSEYSAIYEISPPLEDDGKYSRSESEPFGPADPAWTYTAPDKYSFHSPFVSGVHRMKNGNTLITEGARGRFFEVEPDGDIVWEYWNPYKEVVRLPTGKTAAFPTGAFMYWQFRATHIFPDHPALQGKELDPISPQPDVFVPPPPPSAPEEGH